MSYRAFKRLLGETSLERKCRFLFGAGILLLITASFWWYAHETEHLAYEQTTTTGRLLVDPIIVKQHLQHLNVIEWEWSPAAPADRIAGEEPRPQRDGSKGWEQLRRALYEHSEQNLPEMLRTYQHQIIKPNASRRTNQPEDSYESELLKTFADNGQENERSRPLPTLQA